MSSDLLIPQPAWILNGEAILLEGWHASFGPGGCDRAGGMVEAAVARKLEQGDELIAWVAGEPKWGGRVSRPSLAHRGKGPLEASGYKVKAERSPGILLFQSRNPGGMTPRTGPPWNIGGEQELMGLSQRLNDIVWVISDEVDIANTDHQSIVFVAPKTPGGITRVQFNWRSSNATTALVLRLFKDTYPDDPGIQTGGDISLNATSGSTSHTMSDGDDQLMIQLIATAAFNSAGYFLQLYNIRFNGVADDDTFTASEVVGNVAGRLGWDTAGIQSSGLNVLPLDWRSRSWMDLLAHMAFLQDWYVPRICPKVGADGRPAPAVTWGPWGDRTWPVSLHRDAEPTLNPLELANGVVVHWRQIGGADIETTVRPSDLGLDDPLAGKDADNFLHISLPDEQPDSNLATAAGKNLLARRVTPQYDGTLEVASVGDGGTVWDLLSGDAARAFDFGPLESRDLLIDTVELREGEPATVGVRSPGEEMALVATVGLERARAFHQGGVLFDEAAFQAAMKAWRKDWQRFMSKGKKGERRAYLEQLRDLKGHPKQRGRLKRARAEEREELLEQEPSETAFMEPF